MKTENKILKKILKHKKALVVFLILIIGTSSYFLFFKKNDASGSVSYTIKKVEKGTLVSTVSGTGTVSAYNQVELKPKVTGDITSVVVSVGDNVKKGDLIATIDSKDANKSVRDAELAYASAKLAYDKTVKAAEATDINAAKNNVTQAQYSLAKTKEDTYSSLVSNVTSLAPVMDGLYSLLYDTGVGSYGVQNIKAFASYATIDSSTATGMADKIYNQYALAKASYDSTSNAIKSSDSDDVDELLALADKLNTTSKLIASTSLQAKNLLEYVSDDLDKRDQAIPSNLTSTKTAVNGYLSSANTVSSGSISLQTNLSNASYSVSQKQDALNTLINGPKEEDIAAAKISLQQRANSLADAREKLSYYRITSPFDGVIAKMNIKSSESISSDSVSSGSSIATIVAKNKMAEITMNEVDISKVKVGQKATVTFDAIDGLSISGTVAEMDLVGQASSGVISYTVKISFDTQDDRIKSGMSVNAAIITNTATDVISVPSSAVKTLNGATYVMTTTEITDESQIDSKGNALTQEPQMTEVEVSSDDGDSAIIESGLNEGQFVITKTSTKSSSSSKTTTTKSSTGTIKTGTSIINMGGGQPPRD